MSYVLEDEKEFERLERQSKTRLYDPERELEGVDFSEARRLLDAGSGSGIVSRLLARRYPKAEVVGVEQSELRVKRAQKEGVGLENLHHRAGSITALPEASNTFDGAVCRFVLEHMSKDLARTALREILRCLRPGGELVAIDIDGIFHNLYPRTERVQGFLDRLQGFPDLDLQIGRKLPSWMVEAGFENVSWRIDTMEIRDDSLDVEAKLIEERFSQTLPTMAALLGSENEARAFQADFLQTLRQPGAVLFYSKFIVRGRKGSLRLLNSRS